jgi:hypothetical protein
VKDLISSVSSRSLKSNGAYPFDDDRALNLGDFIPRMQGFDNPTCFSDSRLVGKSCK